MGVIRSWLAGNHDTETYVEISQERQESNVMSECTSFGEYAKDTMRVNVLRKLDTTYVPRRGN